MDRIYSAFMPFPPLKRQWLVEPEHARAQALAEELKLPLWVAQILAVRGHSRPESFKTFLHPRLEGLPMLQGLCGLDEARLVLIPAIQKGSVVGVAGDYDADGVAASAILAEFFTSVGCPVVCEIPHRLEDGYGFSPQVARRLADKEAEVIITADCGISDHEGVARAQEFGIPVVVTDHHQIPPGPLVPAAAVLNPQRPQCSLPGLLAGVGVAFYLAAGLRAALREDGFFNSRPEPNLRRSLDLVALGTCADIAPLTGANRILVSEGLKVLNQFPRPGLAALAAAGRKQRPLNSRDLVFTLAPRVNAAGRLASAGPALELMLTRDQTLARNRARELDRINTQRRELEKIIFTQALDQVESLGSPPFLVLTGERWHRGVLGIVASRLVEITGRPTLVLSLDNGLAVGSGRSVPGFHLQKALAAHSGLLEHYGGHAMAAGLTIKKERIADLAACLSAAAEQSPAASPGQGPPLHLEARVALESLSLPAVECLGRLEPFGHGNPEPMVLAHGVRVASARLLAQGHLKLQVEQNNQSLPGIAFRWQDEVPVRGSLVDLACIPCISTYQGRHVDLQVMGLRPANT